jgi:hypothetical protein
MQGFEKLSAIAGIIAGLLAIGAAFETFTNLGLIVKLVIAGAAGLGLSLSVAGILANWTRAPVGMPGFGGTPPRPPPKRVVASVVALLVPAAAAVALAIFVIAQFATRVDESMASDKSTAVLTATLSKFDRMTIQLPDRKQSNCRWSDQSTRPERLDLQIIDWDSPVPKLQVDNFRQPQELTIECRPAARLRGIFVEPASAVLYRAEQIGSLRFWVFIIGGMIWLVACGRYVWLLWH